MPKPKRKRYRIEVWETRSYSVVIDDADDEDEAKEEASEHYTEKSESDCFVSVEVREVEVIEE